MEELKNTIVVGNGSILVGGEPIESLVNEVLSAPKHYTWNPKPDITTHELSQCFPIVTAMQMGSNVVWKWRETIDNLPENCQRHFEVVG